MRGVPYLRGQVPHQAGARGGGLCVPSSSHPSILDRMGYSVLMVSVFIHLCFKAGMGNVFIIVPVCIHVHFLRGVGNPLPIVYVCIHLCFITGTEEVS